MLKLEAETTKRTGQSAAIYIHVNGQTLGALDVEVGEVDELVALLNAATEMCTALRYIYDTKNYHTMKGHAGDVLRGMAGTT